MGKYEVKLRSKANHFKSGECDPTATGNQVLIALVV